MEAILLAGLSSVALALALVGCGTDEVDVDNDGDRKETADDRTRHFERASQNRQHDRYRHRGVWQMRDAECGAHRDRPDLCRLRVGPRGSPLAEVVLPIYRGAAWCSCDLDQFGGLSCKSSVTRRTP